MPEAFGFAGEARAGYWVSKYDVQVPELAHETIYYLTQDGQKKLTTTNPSGKYTIYLDGKEYETGITLPYDLKELDKKSEYDICLVSETTGKFIGRRNKLKNKLGIEVDLSGFNPDNTYYVIYDEKGGNEQRGEKIQLDDKGKAKNMPENWYNYEEKRWANIVTENNGLKTYWTYIPRYEYKILDDSQTVEIVYILSSEKTADVGYKIPEAFTFGGVDLAGYWVSKYDVQEKN